MEFSLHISGPTPDPAVIEQALLVADPAALLDFDADDRTLRVSTSATKRELLDCLRAAGVIVSDDGLVRRPSVCCGGCGG